MKTLKSLLMLCAGLSFCACNSDNEPQFPEGTGAVEVKIVAPQTRAGDETPGTEGTTVEVGGNIYVTVVHNGTEEWTQKVTAGQTSVKFYGVISPTLVKVSMNGGEASYDFDDLTTSTSYTYNLKDAFGNNPTTATETFDMQSVSATPVYGEAVPTLTGTIEQPADQPEGASKKYQMYTATVNLKIPVARLEVSIDRGGVASTQYASLDAIGAYLDKLYPVGVTYDAANEEYPNITPTTVNNYYYSSTYYGSEFTAQGTAVSPLRKEFTSTPFVAADAVTEVAGFNFFGTPSGSAPHFKFIFNNAEAKAGQTAVPSVMYAKIINYKVAGSDSYIALNNGEIYKIIGLDVADSNINMMEDDGQLEFGLTATVVKARWTIREITGTWAN